MADDPAPALPDDADLREARKRADAYDSMISKTAEAADSYCTLSSELYWKGQALVDVLREYGNTFSDKNIVKTADVFNELLNLQYQITQEMDGIVGAPLRQSIKADLDQLRVASKGYSKARERLERAMHRAEPAFDNGRLLYRNKLAFITDKKTPEFGSTLWKVLGVHATKLRSSVKLLSDSERLREDTMASIEASEKAFLAKMDAKDDKAAAVPAVKEPAEAPVREGALVWQKKKDKWKRVWCVIAEGAFATFPSFNWRDGAKPIHVFNLQLASVKPVPEAPRPFCFQLATPDGINVFETSNENDMKEWLAFIKEMVAGQLRANQLKLFVTTDYSDVRASTSSLAALFSKGKTPFALVAEGPGNTACADCGRKAPDWASISLGVLICYECSAVHRNLGAHISKVRSLTLDKWEPTLLHFFLSVGNERANARTYAAVVPAEQARPVESCDHATRDAWISAKYREKKFVPAIPAGQTKQTLVGALHKAVLAGELENIQLYLAQGVDVNGTVADDKRTALHVAAAAGLLAAADYLIQNGASLAATDANGQTPLHRAALYDHAGTCRLLLTRGAFPLATDTSGKTASQVAQENACAAALAVLQAPEGEKKRSGSTIGGTPALATQSSQLNAGPSEEAIAFFSRNSNPVNKRGSVIASLFSLLDTKPAAGPPRTPEKAAAPPGARIGGTPGGGSMASLVPTNKFGTVSSAPKEATFSATALNDSVKMQQLKAEDSSDEDDAKRSRSSSSSDGPKLEAWIQVMKRKRDGRWSGSQQRWVVLQGQTMHWRVTRGSEETVSLYFPRESSVLLQRESFTIEFVVEAAHYRFTFETRADMERWLGEMKQRLKARIRDEDGRPWRDPRENSAAVEREADERERSASHGSHGDRDGKDRDERKERGDRDRNGDSRDKGEREHRKDHHRDRDDRPRSTPSRKGVDYRSSSSAGRSSHAASDERDRDSKRVDK